MPISNFKATCLATLDFVGEQLRYPEGKGANERPTFLELGLGKLLVLRQSKDQYI